MQTILWIWSHFQKNLMMSGERRVKLPKVHHFHCHNENVLIVHSMYCVVLSFLSFNSILVIVGHAIVQIAKLTVRKLGLQCELKEIPSLRGILTFSPNGWEFLVQILHDYYTIILDYKFLFIYLQLWQSYAILSATIQFTQCPPSAEMYAGIFWCFFKQLGNFSQDFTRLLYVPIYAKQQMFQLPPTVWCYAILSATTHHAFQPMVDILSIWWWSRLIWHNFIRVADNRVKIWSPV